jgi:hypothetical protein
MLSAGHLFFHPEARKLSRTAPLGMGNNKAIILLAKHIATVFF